MMNDHSNSSNHANSPLGKHLHLIADNLDDTVWLVDIENLRYLYVSQGVEELRGFSPQEVIGTDLEDSLTPDSFRRALQALEEELANYQQGQVPRRRMELELKRKDGTTRWAEISTRLVADQEGPLMALGVSRDITQRKLSEMDRESLIQRLQAALEEQKRLQEENQMLRGLLPICSNCKRIRDENGDWHDLEEYIAARSKITFTHTICPPCARALYPGLKF